VGFARFEQKNLAGVNVVITASVANARCAFSLEPHCVRLFKPSARERGLIDLYYFNVWQRRGSPPANPAHVVVRKYSRGVG
jgi:hypothetical protein